MKELSVGEKAKRYDEALKQIKECTPDENGFITIYPQEIFLELKESEDERIRQFLIHEVTETSDEIMSYRNMNKKDVLAWLKKQGEQNPTWSEEDDYTLGETIQHLEELIRIDKAKHCACDVQYYQRDIDWLKSLRPQNTWKPSDEQMEALLWCVAHLGGADHRVLGELYEQLKKLKE